MDFVDAWEARFAAFEPTDLTADEAADRDLVLMELAAYRFGETDLAGGPLGPARVGLPAGRRDLPAPRPRVRAPRRPARLGRPPDRRHLGHPARGPARAPCPRRPAGLAAPHRDGAAPARRHRRADRRRARAGGAAPTTPPCATSGRSSSTRPPTPAGRSRSSRPSCATSCCRSPRARAGSGRSCSRASSATRSARATRSTRCSAAPRPSTPPSAPRWCASRARCGRPTFPDRAMPASRRPTSSGPCSTTSGASTRARTDLLEFCRDELGRIEAFVRTHDLIGLAPRPARDPLDAGLPALVRRRDARFTRAAGPGPEGVLRDHADPRGLDRGAGRVLPARGQRPDAPAAHDPRGRARPLPPGRLREPRARRSPDRSSGAGCSPRAGRST